MHHWFMWYIKMIWTDWVRGWIVHVTCQQIIIWIRLKPYSRFHLKKSTLSAKWILSKLKSLILWGLMSVCKKNETEADEQKVKDSVNFENERLS